MATMLALAPLTASAVEVVPEEGAPEVTAASNEDAEPEAAAASEAETLENAPDEGEVEVAATSNDEGNAAVAAASEAEGIEDAELEMRLTSATVYCYEAVWYDDPTVTDPGRRRFLGTHVAEDLEVGHVIEQDDLWKLAAQFGGNYPDYVFFDGGSVYGEMKENPEENAIVLVAARTKSPSVVNYYLVGEASGAPLSKAAPIVDDVDGVPVSFWKMGSYDVESLKLGAEITSAECAVPLDDLVYLASDKASILVEPLASANELNLFYTIDTATTLPDDTLVEGTPATDQPNQPGNGATDGAAGPDQGDSTAPDNSESEGSGVGEEGASPAVPETSPSSEEADAATDQNESEPDSPSAADDETTTVIEDEESPLAAEHHGVLTLPQTSDQAFGAVALLTAAGFASLGAAAAAGRCRKSARAEQR